MTVSPTGDIIKSATATLMQQWIGGKTASFRRVAEADPAGRRVALRGSTSSPRATLALIDALRFYDGNRYPFEHRDAVVEILRARAALLCTEASFEIQRDSNVNSRNAFTDSHLAIEALVLSWLGSEIRPQEDLRAALFRMKKGTADGLRKRYSRIASSLSEMLRESGGGTLADERHDFVTYAAQRAIDLTVGTEMPDIAAGRVHASVLTQIAYHASGMAARFDLAALVYGICILNRLGSYYDPVVRRAIDIVQERQSSDGSWPELRTISGEDRNLFVSSYEVGLALANLLLQRINESQTVDCGTLFEIVRRVIELAAVEARPVGGSIGWANDRNPSSRVVETWTTAIVASLAVRYDAASSYAHSLECFDKYNPYGVPKRQIERWPDIEMYGRIQERRESIKSALSAKPAHFAIEDEISDPSVDGDIARELIERVILPIRTSWVERTGKSGVSILLPGDPGTRKTTLVNALAHAIDWPVLTLTPPVFLREGLDRFESTAAEVFGDLQGLSNVVVFFDECEEFFRKRVESDNAPSSRTIGAFITAGMLPRLQSLHDSGRVIFVVATNARLAALDPAATREGRFDIRREMLSPALGAQVRYLRRCLARSGKFSSSEITRCIDEYRNACEESTNADRIERIPFARLDRIAERLESGGKMSPDVLAKIVDGGT